jgi:hypothetical protein
VTAHQDACGAAGSRLGIFVNNVFMEYAAATDPYGLDATARILADLAPIPVRVEALLVCVNHPQTAAVDCTICDPED